MPVKFAGTVRRERDSNPRTFWVNGFQDRRIRPLCHLSGATVRMQKFLPKLFITYHLSSLKFFLVEALESTQ